MNVATILRAKGHNVVTVRPSATIAEIVQRLRDARIGAVVVSSGGLQVQGILSERDIVAALAEYGPETLDMQASQLMTRDITTCAPDDSIAELMSLMTARRIRHLPVCEDGALSGIISIGDVVKSRVDEIEHEAEALKSYVMRG